MRRAAWALGVLLALSAGPVPAGEGAANALTATALLPAPPAVPGSDPCDALFATTPAPAGANGAAPHVREAVCVTHFPPSAAERRGGARKGGADGGPPAVELRDQITLQVDNLATLMQQSQDSPRKSQIVLFLDGRPILSAQPYPPLDPAQGRINFVLARDEASREAWTHLLGKPGFAPRAVSVSIGLADQYPIDSRARLLLRTIPWKWFTAWAVLLVAIVAGFLALAAQSNLLRDTAGEAGSTGRAFSLAKTQAMWWFFLVLASYLFIGLVTGDYGSSLNPTALSLIGISAATAVGSALIDSGAKPTDPPRPSKAPGQSWWLDLLSDSSGVNFHRFQMVAWTLVLGVIFIHGVYDNLAMPEFDATMLGLLGISSGTYLGLKINEK